MGTREEMLNGGMPMEFLQPGWVGSVYRRGVYPESVVESTLAEYLVQSHVGPTELALTPELAGPPGLI